jgi:hypothetical protein
MTESNALRRSIKQAYTFLDLFKYLSIIVFSLNMWSDVQHPALKPICSLRISSFLRIYFSSLAFKILLNSFDKQLVIDIPL